MSSQAQTRANGGTIRSHLESDAFKMAVAKALPRHLTPDRFIRVACTTLMRTPKLASCDQASFFNALLTLSQLGIEADGRRAHLIPFENRKRGTVECQLIVDYKGIAELVMRSGLVSFLHADVVCENDEFEYDCGELKRHKIDFRKPRGEAYAAYSLVRFKDGSSKADVMTIEEIEAIRKRSRAGSNGPWVSDWREMAKKTVFRRLSKWLPLSPEIRDAVDADDDQIDLEKPAKGGKSLIAVVGESFELPAQEDHGETQSAETEAGEAAAGLAPEQPAGAPTEKEKVAPVNTPQQQLKEIVEAAGFDFNTFIKWAGESGSINDADSIPHWDDIPGGACAVITRGLQGAKSRPTLLKQLEAVKAGGAA